MTAWLDDAIERTSGPVNEFLRALKEMLEQVQPAALDEAACRAEVAKDGVDVHIAHATKPDWGLWASVGDDHIIAGGAGMHEHFDAPAPGELEGRPWTTVAVDMLAELLRGEIEIRTAYRGDTVAYVDHYQVQPDGSLESFGRTGFLAPGRFALWRETRTEVERVSFDARG